MLVLLYGNDQARLQEKVGEYKSQGYKIFKGQVQALKNSLQSDSLFSSSESKKKFIVNLDFDSDIKLSKELLESIKKSKNSEIVFLSSGNVSRSFHKYFDKKTKLDIKDNKEIFKFLDNLFLGRTKEALSISHSFLQRDMELYLLSMIFFNVKNLLYYHYYPKKFNSLNSFVQQKTEQIAKKGYNKSKLNGVLLALSEADYKIKTGADSKSVFYGLVTYL